MKSVNGIDGDGLGHGHFIVMMKEERAGRLLPLQGWTLTMGLFSLY